MSAPIDLVQWAPKVPRRRILELYENDSAGFEDTALIDAVGWALQARCEAILQVTAAHIEGRITCPACGTQFQREIAPVVLACVCGWQVTWSEYHKTYQGRQLFGGNAYEAFAQYAREFPKLTSAPLKMLAIDQLIHKFHLQIKASTEIIGRPAASNLIEGSLREVIAFLDELSSQNPKLAGSRNAWRDTLDKADWSENFLPGSGGEKAE